LPGLPQGTEIQGKTQFAFGKSGSLAYLCSPFLEICGFAQVGQVFQQRGFKSLDCDTAGALETFLGPAGKRSLNMMRLIADPLSIDRGIERVNSVIFTRRVLTLLFCGDCQE